MRIVTLLSWYDERPGCLAAAVASTAPFATHVVAVDGAYGLYPGGAGSSHRDQADAIRETALACGLGLAVYAPPGPWPGSEVEKRAAMFALAGSLTTEDDWYFVLDGDERVSHVGLDVQATLAGAAGWSVGEVTHWEHRGSYEPSERPLNPAMVQEWPFRKFFRALRGLTVREKHYHYEVPDGPKLWGTGGLEPPLDMKAVRVEHRKGGRVPARQEAADGYYEARNRLNIERLPR